MPAPKGNKFAFGCDTSGRPRLWNSPKELEAKIESYFKEMDNNPILIEEIAGKDPVIMVRKQQRTYTIEGLGLYLGCDRKTLLNYSKEEGYEEYFPILARAKQRINDQHITLAMAGIYNANFARFILSNNTSYKNKEEIEVTEKKKYILSRRKKANA